MGDVKTAMADGEICGTGAAVATETDVTLSVIEDPAVPLARPIVDAGDAVKTVASAATTEQAVELANRVVRVLAQSTDSPRPRRTRSPVSAAGWRSVR